MRIVIDLQAAQSTGSRDRGIGRYSLSLALAIARNRAEHEILIALNGLFPETIEPIRAAFDGLLPQENIRVWGAAAPLAALDANNDWRRQSTEFMREAFLASLRPDVVHVSSLFEGLTDDAVTSIAAFSRDVPTAVTLYDLIPYIRRDSYLENPIIQAWYLGKLAHLRRADLWLAISESSRREGVEHVSLPDEWAVNISTDADPHFRKLQISPEAEHGLRKKYGLFRSFVMYTGGIDHRKNIEGLIRAFSRLPKSLREAHQLAIVCSMQPRNRCELEELAAEQGLSLDEVVLTGFVSEDDLLSLYNLCALFVFPSWHEGFGLPALEAMRCGAPVIGANTSSLPEVIGWNEALFDPYSEEAMAAAIERALLDAAFRVRLVQNGELQSAKFSWDESAKRAITAMERLHTARQARLAKCSFQERRPKLAYVSPLPPERSGIADYSAELVPELARLYEVDVILAQDVISDPWISANCSTRTVQWFVENADCYERVLYHFGNSTFHQHMFDLLKAVPGVVVLHDFFLSGIVAHMDINGFAPGHWANELYKAHGYAALDARFHTKDVADVIYEYPCSLSVIQNALGVIVHSANSLRLAERWYGGYMSDWAVIPLIRDSCGADDKINARKALGLKADDFLVCAFGILGPTKLSQRLLHAWLKSKLAQDRSCHLIFVGENHPGDYGRDVLASIRNSEASGNIRITGWTEQEVFRQYLAAADIGVQLRTLSRGETSAAVLDCMNYGLATIVNANGSMADLDEDAVWKLPDDFSDEQLITAMESLWQNETRRRRLGQTARDIVLRDHNPRTCAEQYRETIERFYRSAATGLPALEMAISHIRGRPPEKKDLIQLANAMAKNFQPPIWQRQLLLDVTGLDRADVCNIFKEWLCCPPVGYRVEPVYATMGQEYRYARRYALECLECPPRVLQEEPIEFAIGDVFVLLERQQGVSLAQSEFCQSLRNHGVRVETVTYGPTITPVRALQLIAERLHLAASETAHA